ncbi:MAG: hypothetical protein HY867_02975 [Chloroflexi bacterium]|nr:hypothetical protein [Chloroflexota bacterium]
MMKKIQFALSLALIVFSLPMLAWGFIPPRRETVSTPLLIPADLPALPEARTIHVTYAPVTRLGDSQVVELNLSADGDVDGENVYEEYNVIVEARLELEGADARPADLVSAALARGASPTFYWEVTQREAGAARGTVWLYLRFVPKAGGEEARGPVLAQRVEARSRSVLGRTGSEARMGGVVGLFIGVGMGILSARGRRDESHGTGNI